MAKPLDNPATVPFRLSQPIIIETNASPSLGSRIQATFQSLVPVSIQNAFEAIQDRRESLGLPFPGTVERISKETQTDVLLNNYLFTGFRADLTKVISTNPTFQVAHNFSMGSPNGSPYSFAAIYASSKGNVDNDLSLQARANYRWTDALVTKAQIQLAAGGSQSMVQVEGDYTGSDFSLNLKGVGPSILEGPLTGIYVADYLQSVTPNLSLGLEAMYQRQSADEGPMTMLAYAARYKAREWIASGQLMPNGVVNVSYWRRLAERVEAGVDLNLQFVGLSGAGGMMGAPSSEGSATFGAKYEFRAAVFRGQIDSHGKVAAVLEKNVTPVIMLSFAGELDHAKNTAKVGLGFTLQSPTAELNAEQELLQAKGLTPDAPPIPPY